MLIRVPFLLIWTWIDQARYKYGENSFNYLIGVIIILSSVLMILIMKKIKSNRRSHAKETLAQTKTFQRNVTRPVIEEIESTDDFNGEGPEPEIIDEEDNDVEEEAQNETSKSDSGIQSVSNCSISSPGKISRWQELIEEGEALNRQLFDLEEPKEWIRKKRLLFGNPSATDPESVSKMSPMTKNLFKRK